MTDTSMQVLLVTARGRRCAIALADVIETMRVLPIAPLADMAPAMRGVAIVRGNAVPVIDLGVLVGATDDEVVATRLVTVRCGGRVVALAVDGVDGVSRLLPGQRADLLGSDASVAAVGTEVLMVVRAAELLARLEVSA